MTGGLVGFERGDSDGDTSTDSDVFGGGDSTSSDSGTSPDDLEGVVSFGDGSGPSSPTGGYDPVPGGVDETTTGRAPGDRGPNVVYESQSSRIHVKETFVTKDGNIGFRIHGTGVEEPTLVRVPIRSGGELVDYKQVKLKPGLPDKEVSTSVSAKGDRINAGGVYLKDPGGGALGRTDSPDPSTVSEQTRDKLVDRFADDSGSSSPSSSSSGMFAGFGRGTDDSTDSTDATGSTGSVLVAVAIVGGLALMSRSGGVTSG